MTNKEAIAILTHNRELIDNGYQYEALDLAIKALEDRPQGDLISRSVLKEAVKGNGTVLTVEHINYLIDNAPTVDMNTALSVAYLKGRRQGQSEERPQDKWGKWIISEIRCPEEYEKYKEDISDMRYTEGLIYIAMKEKKDD